MNPLPEPKTSCRRCGRSILQATAQRTGGLCMPCKKGRISHLPKQRPKPRIPYLACPRYDIDSLLAGEWTNERVAFGIVQSLWHVIDTVPAADDCTFYRPDSTLLSPEITVRDLSMFDTSMGNGWAVSLGYSCGLPVFFRGLRALRTIGHIRGIEMAETVLVALQRHGIPELTTFADDPLYGWRDDWDLEALSRYDWDMEQSVDRDICAGGRDLDSLWWSIGRSYGENFTSGNPSLSYAMCEYLTENQALLRSRGLNLQA